MIGFLSRLWKKRNVNRTQARVLGDSDEVLMCLPSDTAEWVVAKFNELMATIQERDAELSMSRRRVLALSGALDRVTEAVRPYVAESALARRVFDAATAATKV